MARKSIIEIDVQDEKFQRFLKAYGDFQESLDDIPESWKKLDKAIGTSGKRMTGLGREAALSLGLSAENAAKLDKAIKAAGHSTQNLDKHARNGARGFDHLKRSAEGATKIVGRLAGLVGKVGALGLGIAGIGGGAALYGLADLASAAMGRQRAALGAGVSPGTMASWNAYLSPVLGSPSSMLSKVAIARQTASERWALNLASPDWAKEGVSGTSAQILERAQSFMKQYKSSHVALTAAGARGFLQFLSPTEMIRLGNMSRSQLMRDVGSAQAMAPSMQFNRRTGAEWTGLSVQLHAAGIRIETSLINALAPLAPAIRRLSNDLVNWIQTALGGGKIKAWVAQARQGVEKFAAFIGSQKFNNDVHQFVSAIELLSKETMAVAHALSWIVPQKVTPSDFKSKIKAYDVRSNLQSPTLSPSHGMSWGHIMEQSLRSILNQFIPEVHVKVSNSTSSRVDVMSHAAARPQ